MTKKYLILAGTGLAIWAVETAYFGFNAKPENGVEAFLDSLSIILMLWGILGDIFSGMSIHKHFGGDTYNVEYDRSGETPEDRVRVK